MIMAKYSIKGKTTQSLLNRTIRQLMLYKESTLKSIVSRIVSAANKRLSRFEKAGITTPAYNDVMKSGGKFSVKGKNRDELLLEFARAKKFFSSQTSTISGYKKFIKKTGIRFNQKLGKSKSELDSIIQKDNSQQEQWIKDIYQFLDKVIQFDGTLASRMQRYDLATLIGEYDLNSIDSSDETQLKKVSDFLKQKIDENYERTLQDELKFKGVSSLLDSGKK